MIPHKINLHIWWNHRSQREKTILRATAVLFAGISFAILFSPHWQKNLNATQTELVTQQSLLHILRAKKPDPSPTPFSTELLSSLLKSQAITAQLENGPLGLTLRCQQASFSQLVRLLETLQNTYNVSVKSFDLSQTGNDLVSGEIILNYRQTALHPPNNP